MFEKLKSAFSNVAKSFGEKELKEEDIEEVLFELEIALLESDVATEVIDSIKEDLKSKLVGAKVEKDNIETYVRDSLVQSISSLFNCAGKIDLFANIDNQIEKNEPYIILFVGINGTGKTTSLAKIAHLLQKSKYSVVVAAADTFRAGAIEQLKEHTKRLNLKIVAQNYGSDPAAVARDAVLYAKSHNIDCVLVDTAGRMQTSKNLMEQIEKITKVVKPNLKIFVGDSLAGNDTVNQAKEFYEHTKFNGSILTKSDADARGGAALSIVKITSTPVMFVGVGQEYDDLKPFDKETFLETVFGNVENIDLTTIDTSTSSEVEQEKRAKEEKEEQEKRAKEEKEEQEKRAKEEKEEQEKRAKEEKEEQEKRAKEEKEEQEKRAKEEKEEQEKRAKEEKEEQEKRAKEEKEEQEKRAKEEKEEQEKRAKEEKEEQEKRAKEEKEEQEKRAKEEKEEQEKRAKEEKEEQEKRAKEEKEEQEKRAKEKSDDPFEGILDSDIALYADLYDIPPPETDEQAQKMADAIRKWIKNDKPEPGEKIIESTSDDEKDDDESNGDERNEFDNKQKPKKKRGLFGFFRR